MAPTLNLRAFDVPDTPAAAVRLVTLENQCTGQESYAGQQTASATVLTDCKVGSDRGTIVHAAELQVFGEDATLPQQPGPASAGSWSPSACPGTQPAEADRGDRGVTGGDRSVGRAVSKG